MTTTPRPAPSATMAPGDISRTASPRHVLFEADNDLSGRTTVPESAARSDSPSPAGGNEAFAFVQGLAAELSKGKIELPSFPDIVVRVQRVLSSEDADSAKVVRVIGAEPVLAGRVMQMANSAALNPSGRPITNLTSAVTRLGMNIVRSATMAFAFRQMRKADGFRDLAAPLDALWQRSVHVATICFAIGRRVPRASADNALFAGLMRSVGELYILTRARQHPGLLADQAAYENILNEWQYGVAASVLENWGMSDDLVQAVRDSGAPAPEGRGLPTLADILYAAGVLAPLSPEQFEGDPLPTRELAALSRLQFDAPTFAQILRDSASELDTLRQALN
jgi:HD-like signal output (HDOD) protein